MNCNYRVFFFKIHISTLKKRKKKLVIKKAPRVLWGLKTIFPTFTKHHFLFFFPKSTFVLLKPCLASHILHHRPSNIGFTKKNWVYSEVHEMPLEVLKTPIGPVGL